MSPHPLLTFLSIAGTLAAESIIFLVQSSLMDMNFYKQDFAWVVRGMIFPFLDNVDRFELVNPLSLIFWIIRK